MTQSRELGTRFPTGAKDRERWELPLEEESGSRRSRAHCKRRLSTQMFEEQRFRDREGERSEGAAGGPG